MKKGITCGNSIHGIEWTKNT